MFMKAERKKGAKLNEVKPVYIYIRPVGPSGPEDWSVSIHGFR